MAAKKKKILLDPAALEEYSASLAGLPPDDVRRAKREYLENAIANYQNVRGATRSLLIVLGIACLMPFFLLIFIPSFIGFRNVNRSTREKILAAIETWKSDLGDDYVPLLEHARTA